MTNRERSIKPDTSLFLDITSPNTARIFDYLAGGVAHFEVDREGIGMSFYAAFLTK